MILTDKPGVSEAPNWLPGTPGPIANNQGAPGFLTNNQGPLTDNQGPLTDNQRATK